VLRRQRRPFEALLGPDDAVVSDALNHASIIDGIRLCKAARLRYANGDLDELAARLEESAGAHTRMIATDGVFSMDGHIADLAGICDLADRHDALVMVDDSHAVGFVGRTGAARRSCTGSPTVSTSSPARSARRWEAPRAVTFRPP
jgi:glycine C-acetyltransferase